MRAAAKPRVLSVRSVLSHKFVAKTRGASKGRCFMRLRFQGFFPKGIFSQCGNREKMRQHLLRRNFDGFFRNRRCPLSGLAFVRVELLLNSRLPELARVCRELGVA